MHDMFFSPPAIKQVHENLLSMLRKVAEALPLSIVIGLIALVLVLFLVKKTSRLKRKQAVAIVILAFYLTKIFQIVFFSRHINVREIDVIPFDRAGGFRLILIYSLANMLIFIPIGTLIPLIHKKLNSWKVVLMIGLVLSLIIETLQYIFACGSTQVEDVIMNTLGAIVGFLIYRLIFERRKSSNE
ncbi:MAG: VanZ family protein [Eubacterium sp.]|nr:VanZ family protein [Eubacterium sp.]